MKIQECASFSNTRAPGRCAPKTKYDMHIDAKENHVQNIETQWNAGVYTPDTLKSSRLRMYISGGYGCRTRDAEWVKCNLHSRKRITQLLAISIAYWQRPEFETKKTNNSLGLGLCLRFRNVQREHHVKAHWSISWRGAGLSSLRHPPFVVTRQPANWKVPDIQCGF